MQLQDFAGPGVEHRMIIRFKAKLNISILRFTFRFVTYQERFCINILIVISILIISKSSTFFQVFHYTLKNLLQNDFKEKNMIDIERPAAVHSRTPAVKASKFHKIISTIMLHC